jgi:hypothetical protein
VDQIFCPGCRQRQPSAHTYCFRCGEALPIDQLANEPAKRTRFFAGVKVSDEDPEAGFLRVTCYLREQQFEAPEGSVTIPGHHVRFSFWEGAKARCVLSIPEAEARDLARFITEEMSRLNRSSNLTA